MKIYIGSIVGDDWHVHVEETNDVGVIARRTLDPRPSQKIRNHSPDGFSWGYGGSGPAQLALAILLDVVGKERAEQLYMDFKWAFIAPLSQQDGWAISDTYVRVMANRIARNQAENEGD